MIINPYLFPGGKTACLTMSYDDGHTADDRLIEIFDKYGIKGTFHVVNAFDSWEGRTTDRAKEVYAGHELSCHTATHPWLSHLSDSMLAEEIVSNKKKLEDICGYTVRGMSYPYGDFDERIIKVFADNGMKYARTTRSTNNFRIPSDFMAWHPTCHHKNCLDNLPLITEPVHRHKLPRLLYVWGHSYEFNNDGNWDMIEEFCKRASDLSHVWFATNIEIYDYVTAARGLEISSNGKTVFNPSFITVCAEADGEIVEIKPGENRL